MFSAVFEKNKNMQKDALSIVLDHRILKKDLSCSRRTLFCMRVPSGIKEDITCRFFFIWIV